MKYLIRQAVFAPFLVAISMPASGIEPGSNLTRPITFETQQARLRILIDGKKLTINGAGMEWLLTNNTPDVDDYSAYVQNGSTVCIGDEYVSGCHVVEKGKTAVFNVVKDGVVHVIHLKT